MIYTNIQGEVVVGGVFLRLFVTNPGWVLRKPKDFFVEVMDRFIELASATLYSVSLYLVALLTTNSSSPLTLVCRTRS